MILGFWGTYGDSGITLEIIQQRTEQHSGAKSADSAATYGDSEAICGDSGTTCEDSVAAYGISLGISMVSGATY